MRRMDRSSDLADNLHLSLNAYYIYIHPYISLLPARRGTQSDDQPETIQANLDNNAIDQSSFAHWPSSSLSLAICAMLTLIPLPQDPSPLSDASMSSRRRYAQYLADAALKKVDSEIDDLAPGERAPYIDSTHRSFHPDVPLSLHAVLALSVLSIYEDCQKGSLSRMRNLANRAITTSMDMSLHILGDVASEAQRRAWWSVVSSRDRV